MVFSWRQTAEVKTINERHARLRMEGPRFFNLAIRSPFSVLKLFSAVFVLENKLYTNEKKRPRQDVRHI
jgi:hypothetical protein